MTQEDKDIIAKHQKIVDENQSIIDKINKIENDKFERGQQEIRDRREIERLAKLDEKRNKVITRSDVLNKRKTFNQFIKQFINDSLISLIGYRMTDDELAKVNDLPNKFWDKIDAFSCIDKDLYALATNNEDYLTGGTFYTTKSENNCILREAARQYKNKNK